MKRLIAALLLALILTGAVAAQDPTPDPLRPFTLDALRARDYAGGAIVVGDVLETTPSYTHRAFSYSSDGLTVTGVMNVPNGEGPFPVLVLLHGYYDRSTYWSGLGTWQEADFFARQGFLTLAPDFRTWGGSNAGDNRFASGLVSDTIHLIRSLPTLPAADPDRVVIWGHSMGGGVATKVLAIEPRVRAGVLVAPNSADDADLIARWGPACRAGESEAAGDSCNPAESLDGLTAAEAEAYYAAASDADSLRETSPLYQLDQIEVPVQLHIGTADGASLVQTPPEWSYKLYEGLVSAGSDVELYSYPGQGHFLTGQSWTDMLLRALSFYDAALRSPAAVSAP
ncbi:MAG: alpha/beta fold hydrolase [Anaerolineae bacterium]